MSRLRCIVILLLACNSLGSNAQEFSIRKIELLSDRVVLHYDLVDTTRGHRYTMRLFSSLDGYSAPLQKVSGDVGLEVVPGTNRRIIWRIKEELAAGFTGQFDLEVRGRVYVPFIRFDGFEDIKKIKRGVPRLITWTGGSRQNVLNFDLYNNKGESVWTKSGVANDAHELDVMLPNSVKTGEGYFFRVTDNKNRDQEVVTPAFAVKPRFPLVVKIAPVVAVAAFLIIDPFHWFDEEAPAVGEPIVPPGDEDKN